jgi:hypothetical protein
MSIELEESVSHKSNLLMSTYFLLFFSLSLSKQDVLSGSSFFAVFVLAEDNYVHVFYRNITYSYFVIQLQQQT